MAMDPIIKSILTSVVNIFKAVKTGILIIAVLILAVNAFAQ
jgi:hypothetical protein